MDGTRARIVVITPTIGRPQLERCIASVKAQDTASAVRHLIVGDALDTATSAAVARRCRELGAEFVNDARPRATCYPPARASMTRSFGVASSSEPFVAHLDDDNAFSPGHLSALEEVLDRNPHVDIAHSWRRMLDEEGRPCRLRRYPWAIHHRAALAEEVFDRLAAAGIFQRDSEIVRDRMDAIEPDLCHIDTSEWMMRREVFSKVRFQEAYSAREVIYQYTDDFLFCRAARDAGLVFGCSEKATLDYYIGGYSAGSREALES
jgi:glycosyltransferase involved in cell wall biosynthesis